MKQDDNNILRLAEFQKKGGGIVSEHVVAKAFTEQHRGKLLFDHHRGSWYQWVDTHWRREETALAFDWARELAARLAEGEDDKGRSAAGRHSFATGIEKFARADRAFAVTSEIWDCDPLLLATPRGVVELRSGLIRPATPLDHITKITAAAPAETADCARWLKFLDEATGDDVAVIRFIRQWAGYCLTGLTIEHALLFLLGPGKNGKTTFQNVLAGILGDYAVTASMDTFTASRYDKHPTDLAMLRGARLVTAAETEEGRTWAESRIKQITGGDPVTARFMRQDFFTYQPQFKLTIIGNHAPNLRNVDEAARRRFNIVPFNRQPPTVDKKLANKLRQEWPGILRWMVNGCLDWQQNELTPAPAVTTTTEAYFAGQDMIGQWLEDCCDAKAGDKTKTVTSKKLFKSWSDYAKAAGESPGSRKTFAAQLDRRGFIRIRSATERSWQGITLKMQEDDDA